MSSYDPLADAASSLRRVYAYVAYRVGDGPDAEDVTSATLERAVRYRASYEPSKGSPTAWLIGIARACVDDHWRARRPAAEAGDTASPENLEATVLDRVSIVEALAALDDRERELVALRYGAGLGSREIGDVLGLTANAVDVALHRARAKLRDRLEDTGTTGGQSARPQLRRPLESAP